MTVYLVGAGPGDPDLLTVRAARLLGRADVVLVDRLVDRRVLRLVATGALVVDAGKHVGGGDPAGAQARISALLIEHGARAATVVRLKGGDPFVFGRGSEELDAVRDAGIDVEVVPGLSSALALPAIAGVPVTERGVASSVVVATGHDVDAAVRVVLSAPSDATVVLLMAVANRAAIAARLLEAGRAPSTPVAVIERGATPDERRIPTTLEHLGRVAVESPAVLVVGAVASRLVAVAPGAAAPSPGRPTVAALA
ncbi:MAG TPA: uroporphyrinogen-III C-methyltransferase [Acidimicrobiales bacterium]|nr:uroporphyrinogen-III C-methyltransferase [Acidimicrobiales bacterium]